MIRILTILAPNNCGDDGLLQITKPPDICFGDHSFWSPPLLMHCRTKLSASPEPIEFQLTLPVKCLNYFARNIPGSPCVIYNT